MGAVTEVEGVAVAVAAEVEDLVVDDAKMLRAQNYLSTMSVRKLPKTTCTKLLENMEQLLTPSTQAKVLLSSPTPLPTRHRLP